jgi:hypothetical protein
MRHILVDCSSSYVSLQKNVFPNGLEYIIVPTSSSTSSSDKTPDSPPMMLLLLLLLSAVVVCTASVLLLHVKAKQNICDGHEVLAQLGAEAHDTSNLSFVDAHSNCWC